MTRTELEDDVIRTIDRMTREQRAERYLQLHRDGMTLAHAHELLDRNRERADDEIRDALTYWCLNRRQMTVPEAERLVGAHA